MTAHQMICHLPDSYLAGRGGRAVSPAHMPVPIRLMKAVALRVPMHAEHRFRQFGV